MHELILVRHAKSDWGDPGIADHDRPLNARGRGDAPAMAGRLAAELGAESNADPGADRGGIRIVASTAARARATAEAFAAELGAEIEFDPELYLAPPSVLLSRAAAACAAGAGTVLLVAHDPGLSELAYVLSGGGIEHMPTCAVARFALSADALGAGASAPGALTADAGSADAVGTDAQASDAQASDAQVDNAQPTKTHFRPRCADPLVESWSLDTPRGPRVPRTAMR